SFKYRKPRTEVRLTDEGRKAFISYLDSLTKLISQ
ncbi:MAG: transcriptional regulator, partial [Gammaproteobacteria bacterium]|nr:transcriptional regulator [Gammaproteobacteria bacterium]